MNCGRGVVGGRPVSEVQNWPKKGHCGRTPVVVVVVVVVVEKATAERGSQLFGVKSKAPLRQEE